MKFQEGDLVIWNEGTVDRPFRHVAVVVEAEDEYGDYKVRIWGRKEISILKRDRYSFVTDPWKAKSEKLELIYRKEGIPWLELTLK